MSDTSNEETFMNKPKHSFRSLPDSSQRVLGNKKDLVEPSSNGKKIRDKKYTPWRWKIAAWCIASVCIGALALTSAASADGLHRTPRFFWIGVGGILLCSSLILLSSVDQDNSWQNFGHPGGFVCPFVPFLPATCILMNTYLLINIGTGTWIRVSIWLVVGVVVYTCYGRTHSSLLDKDYMPISQTDNRRLNFSVLGLRTFPLLL